MLCAAQFDGDIKVICAGLYDREHYSQMCWFARQLYDKDITVRCAGLYDREHYSEMCWCVRQGTLQ